MEITTGTLIILNGTSSAGKSSILNCLQTRLQEPYMSAGIDKFLYMLPPHYLKQPLWDEVMGKSFSAGDLGNQLMSGMHHALKAMILRGNCILADHVLIERSWVVELAELFSSLPAYLIGVHCPLDVIEKREKERKDRTLGSAQLQFDVVHRWTHYDLAFDSSTMTPEEGADRIFNFLNLRTPPQAFKKILASI